LPEHNNKHAHTSCPRSRRSENFPSSLRTMRAIRACSDKYISCDIGEYQWINMQALTHLFKTIDSSHLLIPYFLLLFDGILKNFRLNHKFWVLLHFGKEACTRQSAPIANARRLLCTCGRELRCQKNSCRGNTKIVCVWSTPAAGVARTVSGRETNKVVDTWYAIRFRSALSCCHFNCALVQRHAATKS